MRHPLTRRTRERGVSLLELVVAITVLSLGTLAAFRSLDQAVLAVGQESPRLLAINVARNRAEELALLGARAGRALPGTVRMGQSEWNVDISEEITEVGLIEATIRVSAPDLPGAVLVTYVPVDPEPEPETPE